MKRGTGRNNAKYKTPEIFKRFKQMYSKHTVKKVTEFSKILGYINEEIIKTMILDNTEVILPYKLGKQRIKRRRVKYRLHKDGSLNTRYMLVDWKKTNTLWEKDPEEKAKKTIIYITNNHSNGLTYNFFWSKLPSRSKVTNIGVICFRATKANRQFLAKCIKNDQLKLNFFE